MPGPWVMLLAAPRVGRLGPGGAYDIVPADPRPRRGLQTMPRPVLKTTCANRRACSAALTLAAAWLVLPLPVQAARLVPVYTVDVAERGGSALQDALRQVLVRATGHREAADDPALAALVADAPKYVKDWDTGARGQSQVVFDGAAIERAVMPAGRTLWDPARPFPLIVLEPPRSRAAADAARAQL